MARSVERAQYGGRLPIAGRSCVLVNIATETSSERMRPAARAWMPAERMYEGRMPEYPLY